MGGYGYIKTQKLYEFKTKQLLMSLFKPWPHGLEKGPQWIQIWSFSQGYEFLS